MDSKSVYPKNAWYVAAQADEIATGAILARRICGLSMVLWRNEAGTVAALEDICPHRAAPLSLGVVRGANLVCGYHGLAVDCQGVAADMPGQTVKNFRPVRSFPVVERFGFIWIWPGDSAIADADRIATPHWYGQPDWAYGGGIYHMACNYQLLIDNLMDLTHETYVHSSSIGQKEIDESPVSTRVEAQSVVTERHMNSVQAPPFWQSAMSANGLDPTAVVDRWQICRFQSPSNVMIDVGVALQGHGGFQAPDDKKVHCVVVDYITPESDTTCWYFWGMARHFKADDAALTESIRTGQGKIFAEDREVLARQQENLLQYPQRRLMTLNIDAGGVHARRHIEKLVKAELCDAG